jgi:crotonobetainyl-CoA:carnitine CoA-transferase CaiB-like acyl-CoA transferase
LELIEWLKDVFSRKTLAEWEKELAGLEVCCSAISRLDEVLGSELFRQREMVCTYQGRDGKEAITFGIPVKLGETPGSLRTPPAGFGEHTRNILLEMGYGEGQIREFFETGIV